MGMGEPLAPPVPQLHASAHHGALSLPPQVGEPLANGARLHASAHHGALSLPPQVGEPLANGARHPYVLSHPVDRSRRAVQRLAGLCQSPAADGREPTAVHCRRPLMRNAIMEIQRPYTADGRRLNGRTLPTAAG
jgi:hypothetical protein